MLLEVSVSAVTLAVGMAAKRLAVREVFSSLKLYYRALWHMLVKRGSYDDLRKICNAPRIEFWKKYAAKNQTMTAEEERCLFAAVWLQSLAATFDLWDEPHYRADSLRHDLVANFSNISFAGTGIPFSLVCCCKLVAILYFVVVHPWVVLVSSLVIARSEVHCQGRSIALIFRDELLTPGHWFALWRINSTLVAAHHHAHGNQPQVQAEYNYENKWEFLKLALKQSQMPAHFPRFKVTPIITNVGEIVCKHKNIEGGMGIHMYKNATEGGDWILQERLRNCDELQELLPADAPLSTFRVITMTDPTAESFDERHVPMTFVWRAGRSGKTTDHSSILFAVDPDTLRVQGGKMFSNWYQVGKLGTQNLLSQHHVTTHPDTKQNLQGRELTCAREAIDICVDAHRRLMPNVPAVGWDVGVADGHGALLLEANLSCNFFGGVYDKQRYLRIVDTYFANGYRCGPPQCVSDEDDAVGMSTTCPGSSIRHVPSSVFSAGSDPDETSSQF